MDLCWEHIQATATIEEREGQFWCLHKKEVTKEILNDGKLQIATFIAALNAGYLTITTFRIVNVYITINKLSMIASELINAVSGMAKAESFLAILGPR